MMQQQAAGHNPQQPSLDPRTAAALTRALERLQAQQSEIAALKAVIAERDKLLALANKTTGKGGDRVPRYKRKIQFQKKVAKAKKAILSGKIEISVSGVVRHCSCGNNTARAIISDLVEAEVLERLPSGRVRVKQ